MNVNEIYAVIAEGENSFCSIGTLKGQKPLVFTNLAKAKDLEKIMSQISHAIQNKVYLVKFNDCEIVREINI